jgi:acyl-CoA thioesterase FadM
MINYSREVVAQWGESDPFGLVYFPRMLDWFNDTEHELFTLLGHPIKDMVDKNRTTFVMGEIQFRFVGPAACGERIKATITLDRIGNSTLDWDCIAVNADTGKTITHGHAIRVYAEILEGGSLRSVRIPDGMRELLSSPEIP